MRPGDPVRSDHQSPEAQSGERLKALYELSMTLSGDPVEIFRRVAQMTGELLDVRVVCLSEIRGDELHFLSVYIDGEVAMDAGHCPLAVTPCATVEQTKDVRIYERVAERFPAAAFLKQHNAFAYCGFPSLDNDGNVIAVTCLLDDKPHDFSQEDQDLLRSLGQRIGQEIERQKHLEERARADRALREREVRLVQAQRLAKLASWRWSFEEDRLVDWSPEYADIMGLESGEIQDLNYFLDRSLHPEDRERVQRVYAAADAEKRGFELEYRILLSDGGLRYIHEIAEMEYGGGGRPVGQIGTVQDVSERKAAEQAMLAAKHEAELANRAKSDFLANMSHELRTPLNAIIGFADIIKNETFGPVGDPQYRDYMNDIHGSGRHLLALINDILDMSKIESGATALHPVDLDIPKVVQSCLKLLNERARQGRVKLTDDVADALPALHADARMVKQILTNLLSNAVKFTPAEGEVTVKAWHDPDSGHVLQVIDTGIGIAPEDLPKALARFGQVDSSLGRKYEGTGLGLPLTNSLVELHGGSLELQSEAGLGTTVTVRFPAESAEGSQRDVTALDRLDRAAS